MSLSWVPYAAGAVGVGIEVRPNNPHQKTSIAAAVGYRHGYGLHYAALARALEQYSRLVLF